VGVRKVTFFQVHEKKKSDAIGIVFLFFFILVIFIYFSGAFSGTESNFFPGKVPRYS